MTTFEEYKNSKEKYLRISSHDTNNDNGRQTTIGRITRPVSVEKLAAAFKTIGKLGERFANVVTGRITISMFKENNNAMIKRLQKELLHDCKEDSSSEICIEKQRNAAKLELFSLLENMCWIDEWSDWYQRYTDITPNPIIKPVDAAVLPIVFHIMLGKYYTEGDAKPLWILAVLAAKGSHTPIYIYGDDLQMPPDEIIKLATWLIGVNWQKKIIIVNTSKYYEIKEQGGIEFTGLHPGVGAVGKNVINVDFGDNKESTPKTHRFVTCLMMNYRSKHRHFGSLYLPLQYDWSDANKLRRLRDFRARHSKIACFAGSQVPPVTIRDITKWLDLTADWAAVLVGWRYENDPSIKELARYDQIIFIDEIVYEDLVQHVDFFITNCGAGSVAVAFAAGCPQKCASVQSTVGADKGSNNVAITIHKVGPDWRQDASFVDRMREIDTNLAFYKTNAQTAKKRMDWECKHLWENMPKFFEQLSSDANLQAQVLKEGIPDEYSLGMCPT